MADPSLDPSLAPTQVLVATHGVPSSDIFSGTYLGGPDAATYELQPPDVSDALQGKKSPKSKRMGSLVRKRSGWNAFYKEQFAIYHANNPPETKQNARERKGFSSYAAAMWKQLSPAQKEAYVQRAGEDDALAVSRPVEKLRRKRAGLLDTLGRIVAELETEFGVESLVFWTERDVPGPPDGNVPPPSMNEGEAYGIIGSTTGSRYIEVLQNAQLGPHQFTQFVQAHHPSEADDTQPLLIGSRKRKDSAVKSGQADVSGLTSDDIDSQMKKKSKSNISRDYHDAEFRRLLLAILNSNLSPQGQKTRLPRGFFGPFLEKHGMELVGLPEKPVEIGDGGKIGGWSADALRKNLDAVRTNRVYIRRLDSTGEGAVDVMDGVEEESEEEEEGPDGKQEQEAAMILAESAGGNRRGKRSAVK